jgi:4-cresol dehydrogenase (hydroxylating) flavoprotein subunit
MTVSRDRAVALACDRWTGAIGADAVRLPPDIGPEWCKATLPWPAQPLAILSPRSADEVVACLRIANETGMPVYPVSRGRNWGMGSRLPPRDAVILDLSGLERILDLDMTRGTARIEPGVTFVALQAAAEAAGLAFHLPGFGGPPDASVLANALERGEGIGMAGDRFANLWDLDVALATGERLWTGFSRYGAADVSTLHARPAGPLLEGLFSQSGFGVVLSGRIGLQPTLPYATSLIAEIGEASALGPAVETLRRLVLAGTVPPHGLAIWNGAKRRSSLVGREGIPHQVWQTMTSEDWAVSLVIAAPHRDLLDLTMRLLSGELKRVTRDLTVNSDRDAAGKRLKTAMTGFSDGRNVFSAYAGKPALPPQPGNPDLDGCGFLWLCPVVAFEGAAIAQLAALVANVTRGTALVPAIGLQAISGRALHAYVSLAWDRDDANAEESAPAVHEDLLRGLIAAGMPPYRLGLQTIPLLPRGSDDWTAIVRRIRAALDPNGILAPGRVPGLD